MVSKQWLGFLLLTAVNVNLCGWAGNKKVENGEKTYAINAKLALNIRETPKFE